MFCTEILSFFFTIIYLIEPQNRKKTTFFCNMFKKKTSIKKKKRCVIFIWLVVVFIVIWIFLFETWLCDKIVMYIHGFISIKRYFLFISKWKLNFKYLIKLYRLCSFHFWIHYLIWSLNQLKFWQNFSHSQWATN